MPTTERILQTTDRKKTLLFSVVSGGLVGLSVLLTQMAGGAEKRETSSAGKVSAEQMMIRAHEARAEWKNFPGFTAEIVVLHNGKRVTGEVAVSPAGKLKLTLDDNSEAEWLQRSLGSVIAHRRSSEGRTYNVEFADKDLNHPLGRLIKLNEDLMGSVYRIKDDVITEVHRKMGKTRFTITVTEVTRNKEGKYLPRSYSFSTWDVKTGNLKSTTVAHQEWIRVGKYDLPLRLLWITTSDDGKRDVKQVEFRRHRLSAAKTASRSSR